MEKVLAENRRTLDGLSARCYFYHSRVYELCGQFAGLRGFLHARLRTATLRHNEEAQVGVVCVFVGVVASVLFSTSGGVNESVAKELPAPQSL